MKTKKQPPQKYRTLKAGDVRPADYQVRHKKEKKWLPGCVLGPISPELAATYVYRAPIHPAPKAARVKAHVSQGLIAYAGQSHIAGKPTAVAFIPCHSQAAARKLVKLFNMSEEERVELVKSKINIIESCDTIARAVLAALGLGGVSK